MKITSILNFSKAYQALQAQTLPIQLAYKLNKIAMQVELDTAFYQKHFKEILDKYVQKDENGNYIYSEDGNNIMIKDGFVEQCSQELEHLYSLDCEGYENYFIPLSALDSLIISPDDLIGLMPFIQE